MNRSDEDALLDKLSKHLADGTTALSDAVRHQPASAYVDPGRAAAERASLFRKYPLVLEVSAALQGTGAFSTTDVAGVPVIVVRGADGQVRAFLNVCRHRGNKVCLQDRGTSRRFSCQYHAWTYDLQGKLLTFIDNEGFEGLDKADFGLVELPCEERHGLVWVLPTPGAELDVAAYLGEVMDRDLADLQLAGQVMFADQSSTTPFNWKLGVDTFHEVFHLAYLHKDTVGPLFIGNLGVHEDRGLHHRYTAARKTLPEALAAGPDERVLRPHSSIVHFIFPNTFVTWQMDHVEMWHFYPDAREDHLSATRGRMLIAEPPHSDSARRHWDKNWQVLLDTIWTEDFRTMESIQHTLESGATETLMFGRNEIALQRFHEKLDSELARQVSAPSPDSAS